MRKLVQILYILSCVTCLTTAGFAATTATNQTASNTSSSNLYTNVTCSTTSGAHYAFECCQTGNNPPYWHDYDYTIYSGTISHTSGNACQPVQLCDATTLYRSGGKVFHQGSTASIEQGKPITGSGCFFFTLNN